MGADETRTLLQMMFGAHLSQAIAKIAEIGLADRLGEDETRPVSDLASETGCHERTLYRTMRYLASHGIFAEQGSRQFGHTALSKALRSDAEGFTEVRNPSGTSQAAHGRLHIDCTLNLE